MAWPTHDFDALILAIADLHTRLSSRAARAVNAALTLRNWLIGAYIHNYELEGRDRATYGERLFEQLAERLEAIGIPRSDARELRRYRLFYRTYPQIQESVTPEFGEALTSVHEAPKRESTTPASRLTGLEIVQHLSYTYFVELLSR